MTEHKRRIYLSPSNQEHNIGPPFYGTEERRMHQIARDLSTILEAAGYACKISRPRMELGQVTNDSNAWRADLHMCIHSNVPAGTVAYYHHAAVAGRRFAGCLYGRIAPLTPPPDLGIRDDYTLYPRSGLWELHEAKAPAALIELDSHAIAKRARWIVRHRSLLALGLALAVADYYRVPLTLPRRKVN
jgi:N-acetylmuramoyl-L-alanine amidase